MIDDLDRTLDKLLRHELPTAIVDQVSISFATPDNEFPPPSVTLPAIDLFLYDIRENTQLRNTQWNTERQLNGTATRTRSPIRVDCSYLITAWSSDSSNARAFDEHRLLSETAIRTHFLKKRGGLARSCRLGADDEAALALLVISGAVGKPALERMSFGAGERVFDHRSACQKGIQLASRIKLVQIIGAADMGVANENLRHRPAAVRLRRHCRLAAVAVHADFLEGSRLGVQQSLGGVAVGASRLGVNNDRWHAREILDASIRAISPTIWAVTRW